MTGLTAAKRRQNLAQGGASAASVTLGSRFHKTRENLRNTNPGLRFACPGPNSVARCAGSLNALVDRHSYLVLFFLIIGLCGGCNRGNDRGIGSRTGGNPSSSPPQVSSSAEVVKITTDTLLTSPGTSADAIVRLAITSGYHVNANPATYSYLIATEVKAGNDQGITVGTPTYPVAARKKFEFADEPLAVYEGNIEVKLPLRIDAPVTSGPRSLPITVRVQACDTEKCFPPATLNATIPVKVEVTGR